MNPITRNPLSEEHAKTVGSCLQMMLPKLTDLGLAAKQLHWNVVGAEFLSVHEKLDEVVDTARNGADTVAERMVQLGQPADGRANKVVEDGKLSESLPTGFVSVPDGLTLICDRLIDAVKTNRRAIEGVGELDPLTEDHLIAIGQELEEQLWMLQAMEAK
ncbi:MAG: DNA starvation/stationary phase protection protein [Planctomycetota bacterium]